MYLNGSILPMKRGVTLQEQWYEYEDDNSLQSPRYEECRYTLYQLPDTLHLLTIHSMWLKQHDDENKWKDTGGNFFLPYGVISKVFRGKYLDDY